MSERITCSFVQLYLISAGISLLFRSIKALFYENKLTLLKIFVQIQDQAKNMLWSLVLPQNQKKPKFSARTSIQSIRTKIRTF